MSIQKSSSSSSSSFSFSYRRLSFSFAALSLILLLVGCSDNQPHDVSAGYRYATLIPQGEVQCIDGKVAVDASVYRGLMEMLGVGERCIDFSGTMNPDIEAIAASRPAMFLVSAYDGADISKYQRLGIPIVECRDFLEPSALGRAEWMRYLGRLWGVGERADSLFAVVEQNCQALDMSSSDDETQPTFFFDTIYGAVWYQPSPDSSIGQLVTMAGGRIPFHSQQQGGSLALSKEEVLLRARTADYWLVRYMADDDMTLDALEKLNPVYSQFKAFHSGHVYGCNTTKVPFYDEIPFRPDWLLEDLRKLTTHQSAPLRYFHKLE